MGHIKGKRFAGILAVGLLATGGMGVAVAQGGISANLALSNTIFSQTVAGLDGEGVAIFVGNDKLEGGDVAALELVVTDEDGDTFAVQTGDGLGEDGVGQCQVGGDAALCDGDAHAAGGQESDGENAGEALALDVSHCVSSVDAAEASVNMVSAVGPPRPVRVILSLDNGFLAKCGYFVRTYRRAAR